MKRLLNSKLIAWKNSKNRKPLLLQGARQVGKTYLVKAFGEKEYSDQIYLNFEQNPNLQSLFKGALNPKNIIHNISLFLGKKIRAKDTLLFFDEIQTAPEVLTSLKYFYELAPEYHVIAAGSLLGVSIGKQGSFPVGKVNILNMYPMSFAEYLIAFGEALLVQQLTKTPLREPLPALLHDKLSTHFKLYLFLGGMPEVLQNYLDHRDIAAVRNIQNEILQAYKRDFSKYTTKSQAIKTAELWQSIPGQLAKENKKFKYSEVRRKARAASFEQTITWLRQAGLINIVYNISKPNLPLSGYADYSKFKVYLLDTGLLGAMLDISSKIITEPTSIYSEYNGAFIENYVAQEFVALGEADLYYWTSKSDAEVDFILQTDNAILPLEVKSGLSRNLKSLRSYENKYKPKLLMRTSPRNFIKSGNFINMPLYAIFSMILKESYL